MDIVDALLWFLLIILLAESTKKPIVKIVSKKKTEDKTEMIELAKSLIGKRCLIGMIGSSTPSDGIIKDVKDGAILLESAVSDKEIGNVEIINLEYVARIREYPKNKKGKYKSIVFSN